MGNSNRSGAALYINNPPRLFPRTSPRLSGRTLPPETERAIRRHQKQRAEIENIASLVHRFLFASTFYVRVWVFPRMGPKDNGGTHLLKIERLFPRRSTGLSGGTLPPRDLLRDRESERERKGTESRDKKYRVARTLLPVCVNFLCQGVGVPPDGSIGQWGNT